MKKKISLLVCVLVFVLSFTGCGGSKKALEYDADTMEQTADTIISSFSQMGDADFAQFQDGSDLEVDLTLMQSGLPVERKEFLGMIEAWQAGLKECGAYIGHGDFDIEVTSKEIKLTTTAEFEDRDADIEFVFDEKSNISNMTVSGEYTRGEVLKKAGLNTLLGMGTVFCVLIFIAFIISLFKYIPVIQEKFTKKEAPAAVTETPAPVVEEVVAEDVMDDLELVAVISAAIAASTGTSTDGFVVRKIKRKSSNKWN